MYQVPPLFASRFHLWKPVVCFALACSSTLAEAHGISEASRETMADGGVFAYIWLGAEHMLTGYDHLLFLFGVVFFLSGFRDVVRFITAFTLGHCITLLGATLAGVTANPYLIDAVIALSVVYKGFENLDGFKKYFDLRAPNLLAMVFVFGLVHGFGLSTRLQELPLGEEGLVSRILAFNVGVEIGQVAALTAMLAFFAAWRSSQAFERLGRMANSALVLAGVGLFLFQMNGYVLGSDDHGHHGEEEHSHGSDHGHSHGSEDAMPKEHSHGSDHGHSHGSEDAKPKEHSHGSDHGHSHEEGH
jgi:hydrogenase/urease accessory protein HupE